MHWLWPNSKTTKTTKQDETRIITGSSYDIRSAQILSDLDWPNLAQRRANHLEKLMFKTMNNQVPEYISEKFVLRNSIHNHNLRGSEHNIFIPRPNTEGLKKRFLTGAPFLGMVFRLRPSRLLVLLNLIL